MGVNPMKFIHLSLASALVAIFAAAPAARAQTTWTTWVFPAGANSAVGTLGSNPVTYNGDLYTVNFVDGSYGWSPAASYVGGPVTSTPGLYQLAVLLDGGRGTGGTISFGTPVTDPVMAIFSLGDDFNPPDSASLVFSDPFHILAGGSSIHYGGSSITSLGDTVYGEEGNGTIQFIGTYSSISFQTPQFEHYYGITVGTAYTPEPGTLSLLGLGLGALPILQRRFLKR